MESGSGTRIKLLGLALYLCMYSIISTGTSPGSLTRLEEEHIHEASNSCRCGN